MSASRLETRRQDKTIIPSSSKHHNLYNGLYFLGANAFQKAAQVPTTYKFNGFGTSPLPPFLASALRRNPPFWDKIRVEEVNARQSQETSGVNSAQ